MKSNKFISSSRRRTPWDNEAIRTPTQSFILKKYLNNYDYKHQKLSELDEATFLNTIKVEGCKYCGSIDIKKFGFTGVGVQRYKCKDCGKTFNVLTNTIFDNHKISIFDWVEYLLNIFGYVSFNSTSRNSKTAETTTKYWLAKLFKLLEHYQDNIVLKGTVWIDETFVRDVQSEMVKEDEYDSLAYKHYCIGIGYDRKNVYLKVEGKNTVTSKKWTYNTFINHIEEGSTLIHDQERSHPVLYEPLKLKPETHNATECKLMDDKDNPLTPINKMCSLLKQFLRAHQGYDRDELQDYLNLFSFMMNEPHNKLEKIEYLINCGVTSTISIKYRDYYSKKPTK